MSSETDAGCVRGVRLAAIPLRAHPAGRPPLAVTDSYRLENSRIVEHWDAIQPIPEKSHNDHPMF